jgi:hypothetical protein
MTLEDLGRRAVACKHWRWMEGMQVEPLRFRVVWLTEDMIGESDQTSYFWKNVPDIFPDLSDPATLGCLLALVREAWGHALAQVSPMLPYGAKWVCYINDAGDHAFLAEAEAEALVAALEAAP